MGAQPYASLLAAARRALGLIFGGTCRSAKEPGTYAERQNSP